ncbi:DUF3320 domain-containing protein [Nocardia sp. NPDC050710]|uniref:DUF3320 domain-containing protein n=1 Tax=Nocardia sp. NPDC050710 TaxID=3157220 RepID=UPI0033DF6046
MTTQFQGGGRELELFEKVLTGWRKSLVDLSGRNRLLNFRHTKAATLEISAPSAQILIEGLERGMGFAPLPDAEPTLEAKADPGPPIEILGSPGREIVTQKKTRTALERALLNLRSKSTQLFNDYGLWTLQLGVGMLHWGEEGAETGSDAPLVLLPVRIERTSTGAFRLKVNDEDEPRHNPALRVKLEQLYLDWDSVGEQDPMDLPSVQAAVTHAIGGRRGWHLSERVVMALFASHKESMYQDLLENQNHVMRSDLVRAVALGPRATLASDRFDFEEIDVSRIDEISPPEETPLVLDADASQRQAVAAAVAGHSFILDGPPGTGKSQTITNMIAALVHAGRSVLFVSEKAAALDVVLNRLGSVGLDSYALALHSHNTSRKAVAQELGRALTEEPLARGLSEHELVRARETREALSGYAEAMNEVRLPLGETLHDVVGKVSGLSDIPAAYHLLRIENSGRRDDGFRAQDLSGRDLSKILDVASTIAGVWDAVLDPMYPWHDLRAQAVAPRRSLDQAITALAGLTAVVDSYRELARTDESMNNEPGLDRLAGLLELLGSGFSIPEAWLTSREFADEIDGPVDAFVAELRTVRWARTAAAQAAGERWEELSGRLTTEIGDAERALVKLSPLALDPAGWNEPDARRISREFANEALSLESMNQAIVDIARELGLDPPHSSAGARDICEVVALAGISQRPPEAWLAPTGAREVDRAAVFAVADGLAEFFARCDRVRAAQQRAITQAGPGWAELSPDPEPPPSELMLAELTPVGLAIAPLTHRQVGELSQWFNALSDALESAEGHAVVLAVQLGCAEPTTIEQAEDLVVLVGLCRAEDRPLVTWFDPEVLPKVRNACDEIDSAVGELIAARRSAEELFLPDIVNSPELPGAITRLMEGPRGISGLLSSRVRADRKLIAAVTTEGSWRSQLYDKLPLAATWYAAHDQLRGLTRAHADLLGHYVDADLPDVTRLRAACARAEQVHSLATATVGDPHRRRLLAGCLAHGQVPQADLLDRSISLGHELTRWREDSTRLPLSAYATELSKRAPGQVARWLRAHVDPLQRAEALVDTITTVGGRGRDGGAEYTIAAARSAIADALTAQRETAEFDRREPSDRLLLGPWYRGLETTAESLTLPAPGDVAEFEAPGDLLRRGVVLVREARTPLVTDKQAALLGRYVDNHRVDIHALSRALEAAHTVARLAPETLADPDRRSLLSAAVADGRPARPDLELRVERITSQLDAWEERTGRADLAAAAPVLRAGPFDAVAQWLRAHVEPFEDAADFIRSVSRVTGENNGMTLGKARAAVAAVVSARAAEAEFEASDERWWELLGDQYEGVDTDVDGLTNALDWARKVRRAANRTPNRKIGHGRRARDIGQTVGQVPLSAAAAQTMLTAPAELRFPEIRSEWDRVREQLAAMFETERARQIRAELASDLPAAENLLSRLENDSHGPEAWLSYCAGLSGLAEYGLGNLPAQLAQQRIDAAEFAAVVERALLTAWAEHYFAADARLRPYHADDRDRLVEQFREVDRALVRTAPAAVMAAGNARRPRRTTVGSARIITREAEKQRRHLPVRRILEEARDVVQLIKPCFMMSPLTVSQFLPPDFRFDVVIFDEASQVLPEDAVNSIYRGNALIVVGDQKQLPPTSFFGAAGAADDDDEWVDNDSDAFQSVLDACKASGVLRDLPLRWHYRSRHENLIAFSNHEFYDNTMVTFPGALEDGPDIGVEFFQSNGVYDRGGRSDNPGEAAVVAQRVVHHFATRPWLTLGVVALSKAQAEAIEAAVAKARADRPDLDIYFTEDRLAGFFVKNLENVQGDERDVIILSIGYGPDKQGKLHSAFGPINRPEGWRRLNVAVTRARRRLEVVASFRGGDLPESSNKSVRHLGRYLKYAEHGPGVLATAPADVDAVPDSPFEEQVIDVLRDWGYDVQPQVGVASYRIDMAVRHPAAPGVYALGIECDGAMYHSSRAARDRDRLREAVLRDLGWKLHRIWGTDWYRNREAAIRSLRTVVEAACAADPHATTHDRIESATRQAAVDVHANDDEAKPNSSTVRFAPVDHEPVLWTRPYREVGTAELVELHRVSAHRLGLESVPLRDPDTFELVADIVVYVVEVEGPIEEDLLFTRVRVAWGLARSGPVIQERIREVLRWLGRKGIIVRVDTAYDRPDRELRFVRTPTSTCERAVRHVPLVERQLAAIHVITDNVGVRREELLSEVAGVFGWTRVRSEIRATLTADLDSLIESGVIDETTLGLTVSGRAAPGD